MLIAQIAVVLQAFRQNALQLRRRPGAQTDSSHQTRARPNSPEHDLRAWSVQDQTIPIPYPATTANLGSPTWRPALDSVSGSSGSLGDIRKFSSFLAAGIENPDPGAIDFTTLTYDTRLVGRSVWNTRWLLIIPGATMNSDPAAGLNSFINSIKDIQLSIKTYGYSGN